MQAWLARAWKLRMVGLVLLVGLVALGWMERGRLLTWVYLGRASGADTDTWVARIVALDRAAVPALLDAARLEQTERCALVQRCLTQIAQKDAATRKDVWTESATRFARLSVAGRCSILGVAADTVEGGEALESQLAALLRQAGRDAEASVRTAALALGEKAPPKVGSEVEAALAELTKHGLKDTSVENRARAVRLAGRPGSALNGQVFAALQDAAPEVRREAILAVGPMEDSIATEELLRWLHDPDSEVCRRCEQVLRLQRHLEEHHLTMGRYLTDARPATRLRVLEFLHGNTDLDPGVWLRRLSHDPSPAVRAGTVRALSEQSAVELVERIHQMAQNDPSPTVRQLAHFYVSQPHND